jgi:uncharacterized protein YjbI with pentapeptide repeats
MKKTRLEIEDAIRRGSTELEGANLAGANLAGANLAGANLADATLENADLSSASLQNANLESADLEGANLAGANLAWANLKGAKLAGAKLIFADLTEANLSGAFGVLDPAAWLKENFEADDQGIIVYKNIGNTDYLPPAHWEIAPGSVLSEVCNPDRGTPCGCGVNFATRRWCYHYHPLKSALWRCRIRWFDLAGVVVPFGTNGKARCARLELLETYAVYLETHAPVED